MFSLVSISSNVSRFVFINYKYCFFVTWRTNRPAGHCFLSVCVCHCCIYVSVSNSKHSICVFGPIFNITTFMHYRSLCVNTANTLWQSTCTDWLPGWPVQVLTFQSPAAVHPSLHHPKTLHDSPLPRHQQSAHTHPCSPSIFMQSETPHLWKKSICLLRFFFFPPSIHIYFQFLGTKEYFFSNTEFFFFSFFFLNPDFTLQNSYHSNLPCQSHSSFSLLFFSCSQIHAHKDTDTHLFEIHISSYTNGTLQFPILTHLQRD